MCWDLFIKNDTLQDVNIYNHLIKINDSELILKRIFSAFDKQSTHLTNDVTKYPSINNRQFISLSNIKTQTKEEN